jgi:hypothetical protein
MNPQDRSCPIGTRFGRHHRAASDQPGCPDGWPVHGRMEPISPGPGRRTRCLGLPDVRLRVGDRRVARPRHSLWPWGTLSLLCDAGVGLSAIICGPTAAGSLHPANQPPNRLRPSQAPSRTIRRRHDICPWPGATRFPYPVPAIPLAQLHVWSASDRGPRSKISVTVSLPTARHHCCPDACILDQALTSESTFG